MPIPWKPLRRMLLCLAVAGAMAGCSEQELYRDIDEREANEMVAVLMRAGIESSKATGEKGTFTVQVPQSEFARAVDVLRQNGLPREQYESLGTVFKKEGFTSSSLAERARLVFGISQELSNTISQFDGVLEARVHLALPEADPLTGAANPPSASVFVKYREGFDLPSQTAAIKALVTNSVEGLDYDKVSIAMTEAKTLPVPLSPMSTGSLGTILASLGALIGIGFVALAGWRAYALRGSRSGGPVSRAVRDV